MGAVKTFTLKMKLAKKIKQNRWSIKHLVDGLPSGKRKQQKTMVYITIFDWGNTRKKWPFSIAMLVYQMVDCRNFHVMVRIESKINRHRPLLSLNARLMSVHIPLFCYGDCEAIIFFFHNPHNCFQTLATDVLDFFSYHNLSTGNLHSEPTKKRGNGVCWRLNLKFFGVGPSSHGCWRGVPRANLCT